MREGGAGVQGCTEHLAKCSQIVRTKFIARDGGPRQAGDLRVVGPLSRRSSEGPTKKPPFLESPTPRGGGGSCILLHPQIQRFAKSTF